MTKSNIYDEDYDDFDDCDILYDSKRIQRTNSLIFFRRRMSKMSKTKEKRSLSRFNRKMYYFVIILILTVTFSIVISFFKL